MRVTPPASGPFAGIWLAVRACRVARVDDGRVYFVRFPGLFSSFDPFVTAIFLALVDHLGTHFLLVRVSCATRRARQVLHAS